MMQPLQKKESYFIQPENTSFVKKNPIHFSEGCLLHSKRAPFASQMGVFKKAKEHVLESGMWKYRTNYTTVNIRSFVTLSLHYPVFVLLLLCLYFILPCIILSSVLLLCLCITLFCSFVTLSLCLFSLILSCILFFCYFVFSLLWSIKKDKNLLKGSIKQTIFCIFAC